MEHYPGAPDDASDEPVTDEWVRSALAYLAGELDAEARARFESALAADTPEAVARREWLDEFQTVGDLLAPEGETSGEAAWQQLRSTISTEQEREAAFTAAVRSAAGETSDPVPPTDENVAAIFAAADETPALEPTRDLWPPLGQYAHEEPAVARAIREATGEPELAASDLAPRLRDDLHTILTAAADADWHEPSRDLWPELRARLAEEDAFTLDVSRAVGEADGEVSDADVARLLGAAGSAPDLEPSRDLWAGMPEQLASIDALTADVSRAVGEADGAVSDPHVAEILAAAAESDWLEPRHDLWPALQSRVTGDPAFTADVSRAVGEQDGDVRDPRVAEILAAAAGTPWREPSRDLWPGVHQRVAGLRLVGSRDATTPRLTGALFAAVWASAFGAAAALLVLVVPVLLLVPDGAAPQANTHNPGTIPFNEDHHEHVSPPAPHPQLPSYNLKPYAAAVAVDPADKLVGPPVGDQPTEIVFCRHEARSTAAARFDVPRNLSHRLLAADETFMDVYLPVSIGNGRTVERFIAFRSPDGDDDLLCFDFNDDLNPDRAISTGATVDFALARPGEQLQPYPVRFDRDPYTNEWRATPLCAMVATARVSGEIPVFVDGNLNGRYDDFGHDYLLFHGQEKAVTLAPVVRIGEQLYEVEINAAGTLATFGTYTGSTGLLLVDAHYRPGVTVDVIRLRTRGPDGHIGCEVLLSDDDIGQLITVPCPDGGHSTWVLVNGRVTDGSGGADGMVVEIGNCGPMHLEATEVLNVEPEISPINPPTSLAPPEFVTVSVMAGGAPGHLSLGGPLRMVVEMPETQMHLPELELSADQIALIGNAGERYRVFTMTVTGTLLIKPSTMSPAWVPTGYVSMFDPLRDWPPTLRVEVPRGIQAPMALQLVESSVSVFLQGVQTAITVAVF